MKRIFALLVAVYALLTAAPAGAHDAQHPANDSWLKDTSSGRGPCCDGSDALRVDDPDWIMAIDGKFAVVHGGKIESVECRPNLPHGGDEAHGEYCVRLKIHPDDAADPETAWFMVDGAAVVKSEANRDGQVRVWPLTSTPYGDRVITIGVRCFLPGVQG